jgi:hypothetical protein
MEASREKRGSRRINAQANEIPVGHELKPLPPSPGEGENEKEAAQLVYQPLTGWRILDSR